MQVVHLVIQVKRRRMTPSALALAEKDLLTALLILRGFLRVQPAGHGIELGRRRKIEHVLHLRHVAHRDTVQDVHPFFNGMDFVAVEVSRSLLELRKVLDRTQATFRAVDLLIKYSP